jgi:hypothetical protein
MVLIAAARHAKQLGNPSCLVSKAAKHLPCRRLAQHRLLLLGIGTEMRGERQGRAALAQVGLPTKAAATNVDKATSGLARPPARDLSLSLMVGGGGAVGWRWPADDRQPAAPRCPSFSAWGTSCLGTNAGLVSWSVLSGTPPAGDRPSLGSKVPFVAASHRRTSRPPRQAQLTGSAECWTRRRRQGADDGAEWRCQMASLRQATRLAGECPDPQHVGRESLDEEEWEPPELKSRRRWGRGRGGNTEPAKAQARAGVGISPRPGAGCSARISPRPGTGRVGGEEAGVWTRRRRCYTP